ncbi:unnamed protein product [Toxocara canis]|uniref:SAM-dependent MTase TRM10-type domain-containing protein n=1 Tax=Toxocara canis TaxID=6265 RepID=A0A183UMP7_TOXCA|nr:unnamed protein product [Toxocara canis]
MEVLYEISTEVPRALSDDDWHFYLNLQDIREEQQIRHNRGEMVYAPGFHTYFDIRGQYFRRTKQSVAIIDSCAKSFMSSHDIAFMSGEEDCGHDIYKHFHSMLGFVKGNENPSIDGYLLLPDIATLNIWSQIQRLHDANWFSRCPFPVSIVNLLADDRLARYIKRYWLFLCGPKRVHGGEDEDDFSQLYNELDAYSDSGSERSNSDSSTSEEEGFTPHPFIPTISSRSIRDNLNKDVRDVLFDIDVKLFEMRKCNLEEVVYISGSAPRLLDGPLTNYKAVVICTSYDFQPWSSSLSAARADRLTPFRIPLDRYVKWERGQKVMPVDVTANIIRTVYSNDGDWKSAILENVPEYHFTKDRPTSKRHERSAINIERLNRLKALEEAMLEMDRRRIDALEKSKPRKAFANEQPGSRKRIYEHRYSREERRARTGSQKPS